MQNDFCKTKKCNLKVLVKYIGISYQFDFKSIDLNHKIDLSQYLLVNNYLLHNPVHLEVLKIPQPSSVILQSKLLLQSKPDSTQ